MPNKPFLTEFNLIEKYFTQKQLIKRSDVLLGIGDDAAAVKPLQNQLLIMAMDTLVAGKHFPTTTSAFDVGHKSLAVNLSDLAAMGAEPCWFTLALTLPHADPQWLEEFSNGLFTLADEYKVQLIGGDTTQGLLNITIQAHGYVPESQIIKRSGAKPGDKIYVSNNLGNAGLGLKIALNQQKFPKNVTAFALQHLNKPNPRIALGMALRGIASSAIDISDGLLADLNHILECSQVGAVIDANQIPLSPLLQNHLPLTEAQQLAMTAGDDYELCFTVPPENESLLPKIQTCYCIGTINDTKQLKLINFDGKLDSFGFEHFDNTP